MTQLDIFAEPMARATDPATSHAAAAQARTFAKSHSLRILECLRLYGRSTAKMLGTYTGLSVVQVDRRLPDLQRAGLARVVQVEGRDMERGGFRVWEAV